MEGKGCAMEMFLDVGEIERGTVVLDESVLLCPCLGICGCTVKEDSGELVVIVVSEPPSDGEFYVWCFELLKLLEFGLAVELPFVDTYVGTADVEVACLVVCVLRCVMKWEFYVDCWHLLGAGECVRIRCDVMLLKESFPLLMLSGVSRVVKNAGEPPAVGVDEVLLVYGWAVVDEVFEAGCGGVYVLVDPGVLCGCEVGVGKLVR